MARLFARLIAVAILLSVSAPLPAQPLPGAIAGRIDSLFTAFNRTDAPGLAVAVVRDGRMIFAKGYGMA
ncbi:MAG: hypothetical protein RL409_1229, partial [Gemmatimonadota bacterium]